MKELGCVSCVSIKTQKTVVIVAGICIISCVLRLIELGCVPCVLIKAQETVVMIGWDCIISCVLIRTQEVD